MEATRPLLGGEPEDERRQHTNGHARTRRASLLIIDDGGRDDSCCVSCFRVICCVAGSGGGGYTRVASPPAYKDGISRRERLLSNGTTSSTGSSSSSYQHHHGYVSPEKAYRGFVCSNWGCWKWIFPDRVTDYDDFAASEEMGEIYHIRQKTRELFDAAHHEDAEMVHHLWNALFPTLPYDGRVNPRWRDIGFQNDDPASDFRSSGRFGLKMLLYFADHMNDEFKRLVRENRFPVCLCAINVIEMLLIHLNLKDPMPLVCPCCGTDNAELETSNPSRDRPELQGFISLLNDCSWSAGRSNQMIYASEWPVEVAFAQLFMHTMIVLDSVWKQKLARDPTMTLLHFRDALFSTRKKVLAFLSRRNSPVDLVELAAWSCRYKNAKHTSKAKPAKKCM